LSKSVPKWDWGGFEGDLWRRAHLGLGLQIISIVAVGWFVVCDGLHRGFVMKKGLKVVSRSPDDPMFYRLRQGRI